MRELQDRHARRGRSGYLLVVLLAGCVSGPRVVVTGGVHGNEPSGAKALPELAKRGCLTYGPCNPWGLEHDRRELEDGRDLNRLFGAKNVPEVARVREFLEKNRPGLFFDLHEDGHATGPYLIQIDPDSDLAARVVAELKLELAFELKPTWGPVFGRDGVLKPDRKSLGLQALSNQWSLAFYVWWTYKITAFTIEVPHDWPMERKIAAHLKIVEAAKRLRNDDPR